MSNVVVIDRTINKELAVVQPMLAAQKFIQFQVTGGCSTTVPSLTIDESLAWWGQMFSEVDDGCGEVSHAEVEDI